MELSRSSNDRQRYFDLSRQRASVVYNTTYRGAFMRAGIALYLAVGLASADRLLEATVREAAMSSPEWWEAHHQLAKLKPGTSWFGPIGRAIARDIAKRHYTRSCALGDAVVLGSGYSKTPYWLGPHGRAFRRVYGIDSSISAVRAMSRYAKALDHGGRGWDIVRYVRADVTRPGQFRRDASLVLDEGVLDVPGGTGHRSRGAFRRETSHG